MYGKNILLFGKEKKETFIGCAEKRNKTRKQETCNGCGKQGEVSWGESFCAHPSHLMQKNIRGGDKNICKIILFWVWGYQKFKSLLILIASTRKKKLCMH